MVLQQTLILIKPDGVARGLTGEIIKRFERIGLKIVALKLVHVKMDHAKLHYTEDISNRHGEKVRNNLLDFLTEGPVVAMILEGVDAIAIQFIEPCHKQALLYFLRLARAEPRVPKSE